MAAAAQAALGGDHQSFGVGVEGFGDDLLAHVRAVGIRGIDEVDAEPDGLAHDLPRRFAIGRLAPDARARDPHPAEADPVDGKVADERRGR